MLGVIIGVGAVVAMVAIGQGARAEREAAGAGAGQQPPHGVRRDRAAVRRVSRGDQVQTLTTDDAEAIRHEVPGVVGVSAEFARSVQVVYRNQNTYTPRSPGVTPEFPDGAQLLASSAASS